MPAAAVQCRIALFLLLAGAAVAQNGPQFNNWKADPAESPARPVLPCAGLRALTGYEFTVITAALIPASADAPEHCRISGQVLPEVRFEVNLPSAWNRRLYMFGNGGYAGEPFDAPPRVARRNQALRNGFAVAATNTGHDAAQEPLATFAVHPQKLFDYAFRSLHVTAQTAKKLAAAYYGNHPARSYFDGCSTGGRQGLILAQRFPKDFNGIVVGAPVLHFTGTMVSYAWMAQALAAAPIPTAKLPALARAIYERCDGADGLRDGLIDDPRRCDFQPAVHLPRCASQDDAGCFTSAQIETLRRIYSDVRGQGKRLFPGWPVGAEIAGPNGRSGWEGWIVRDNERTISVNFAESFFRFMAFPKKNTDFQLSAFDFDRHPEQLEWIAGVLDATDTDLTAFRDAGGKILMYYGWADQALNALMGVEYYEAVRQRMGQETAGFFRLFMIPGLFHCGGGIGTGAFDPVTAVINWVEKGAAPDAIRAARIEQGKVLRTRPLCPYPQVARYKGTGSIDEADNFRCAAPQQ